MTSNQDWWPDQLNLKALRQEFSFVRSNGQGFRLR